MDVCRLVWGGEPDDSGTSYVERPNMHRLLETCVVYSEHKSTSCVEYADVGMPEWFLEGSLLSLMGSVQSI